MKRILLYFLLFLTIPTVAQDVWPEAYVIKTDTATYQNIPKKGIQYIDTGEHEVSFKNIIKPGYSAKFLSLAEHDFKLSPLKKAHIWIRYRLKNETAYPQIFTFSVNNLKEDIYINKKGKWAHFASGYLVPWSKRSGMKELKQIECLLKPGEEIKVYDYVGEPFSFKVKSNTVIGKIAPPTIGNYLEIVEANYHKDHIYKEEDVLLFGAFGFIIFAAIFNLFFYYINREKVYLTYSILLILASFVTAKNVFDSLLFGEFRVGYINFSIILYTLFVIVLIRTLRLFFRINIHFPKWDKFLTFSSILAGFFGCLIFVAWYSKWYTLLLIIVVLLALIYISFLIAIIVLVVSLLRKKDKEARLFVIAAMPFLAGYIINMVLQIDWLEIVLGMWTILVLSWGMFARFKSLQIENARAALEKEEERNRLIAQQNEVLEQQVAERTAELQHSLESLKQTQAQLIQSEKMASLGELTAGIAHEIQNPLNFVNNFSDVSIELLQELKEETAKGDIDEVNAITDDVIQNLEKIAHHGRRADSIVKGMLQHSRSSSGQKEPTDINVLADEFLRLAYHGLRAKDKSFNADMITNFGEGLPKITIVPQDVGRVLLNLFNNAFYATQEKSKQSQFSGNSYKPVITVTTLQKDNAIQIIIKDNGIGIPADIKDKILQPFFTTKPTGEGTGLGLSLSYDIIVKGHGGTVDIESTEGEGALFIISLPVN